MGVYRDVLVVVTDTDRRGGQTHGALVARGLREAGVKAEAIALAPGANGRLDVPVLGPSRRHPATLAALRDRMAGARVAVAFGSTTLPACATASARLATPFVYVSIGDIRAWTATPARRWRTAALLRRARRVVALWPEAAAGLREHVRVPPERIRVVPTAVDAREFPAPTAQDRRAARGRLGVPEDATVVAAVGALAEEKRVDKAIDAVARLDGGVLVVAGVGPQARTLVHYARETAPGHVRWLGQTDDVAGVLAAADMIVLPSRTEGLPAVLIEAALTEVPAVASDVGGVSEVVADGVTGRLVAADASGDEIAAALGEVAADRARLGAAARQRAQERFDLRVVAERWVETLEPLV